MGLKNKLYVFIGTLISAWISLNIYRFCSGEFYCKTENGFAFDYHWFALFVILFPLVGFVNMLFGGDNHIEEDGGVLDFVNYVFFNKDNSELVLDSERDCENNDIRYYNEIYEYGALEGGDADYFIKDEDGKDWRGWNWVDYYGNMQIHWEKWA